MSNDHIITDGKNFKIDGGCRPPTDEEAKLVPHMPKDVLDKIRAKAKAQREAKLLTGSSKVEQYNAAHWDDNQGGTGCCTAGAANAVTMAAGLFLQNIRIPHPSMGFGYYTSTNDPTFKKGYSVSAAVMKRTGYYYGCCANALYSQDWLLTQFNLWQGAAFNASQLPQPAAYADAKTRTVIQWHSISSWPVPVDMNVLDDLLDTGHPIGFGIGRHAMCLIDRSADGWWYYAKDSLMADVDNGNGRGIRTLTRDALATGAFDLVTVTLIEPGSLVVSPPGNTQMLIDTIKADANGLVLGQVTQTQVDNIKADVAMLVADAPTNPIPIPPTTNETVWFGTSLPAGCTPNPSPNAANEPWTWVTDPVYSQAKAHQSEIRAGIHQHYFNSATAKLSLGANDKLFAYTYLDPANPPKQILLMWYGSDDSWSHQAYWGANNIPGAVYVGPLPALGAWTRLEVPASTVGLAGKSTAGMSFKLFDGRATWDRCGKFT